MASAQRPDEHPDNVELGDSFPDPQPEGMETAAERVAASADSASHTYHITFPECSNPDFIIELLLYIIFMSIFTAVMYNIRDPKYSYLQSFQLVDLLLQEEFPDTEVYKSFQQVTRVSEFWQYMLTVFPGQMFSDQGSGPASMYGTNYIVGSVRLRQVRVKQSLCALHQDFSPELVNCFARYSLGDEDRQPYGPGGIWTYQSCSELKTVCKQFARLRRYDGGGYPIFLTNGTEAGETAALTALRDSNWVDLLTRAVFIDFTAFNPSVNMFFIGQMSFEFMPTGGILPDYVFRVARLYRYEGSGGRLQMAGEVAIVVFVGLFLIEEISQMIVSCVRLRRNQRLREASGTVRYAVPYFKDAWNYVDWLNILVFLFVFLCRYKVESKFQAFHFVPGNRSRHYDFTGIVAWDSTEKVLLGCNAFLLWFKCFKFAVVIAPRMGMIVQVVAHAFFPLFFFMLMFLFVLMGFAQAGAIAFGSDVRGFDTIGTSIFTVLLTTLGDRDLEALRHSNRVFGPFYFFTFVIIVVFIALSMFLAIVDSAYEEVASMMQRSEEPSVFTKALAWFSTTKVGSRLAEALDVKEKLSELRSSVEKGDLNRDGLVSEAELALLVRNQRDYFEGAAADLMEKYDVDNDKVLSASEREAMYRDIEREQMRVAQRIVLLSDASSDEFKILFELLSDRVAKVETRLESHIETLLVATAPPSAAQSRTGSGRL